MLDYIPLTAKAKCKCGFCSKNILREIPFRWNYEDVGQDVLVGCEECKEIYVGNVGGGLCIPTTHCAKCKNEIYIVEETGSESDSEVISSDQFGKSTFYLCPKCKEFSLEVEYNFDNVTNYYKNFYKKEKKRQEMQERFDKIIFTKGAVDNRCSICGRGFKPEEIDGYLNEIVVCKDCELNENGAESTSIEGDRAN